jgi:hypothetical protein
MIGSYNACLVNQINDLRDFETDIKSPKVQAPCAGETSKLGAHARICRGCRQPFTTNDGRRRFCSDECRRQAFSASLRRRQAEHRERYPQRIAARQTLKNAILLGKVRRCTRCEECGAKTFTEGHHDDYAKPFYVTWLCRRCHARLEDGAHFGRGEFKHAETLPAPPVPAEGAL